MEYLFGAIALVVIVYMCYEGARCNHKWDILEKSNYTLTLVCNKCGKIKTITRYNYDNLND